MPAFIWFYLHEILESKTDVARGQRVVQCGLPKETKELPGVIGIAL